MLRLFYISTVTSIIDEDETENIINHSREKNARLGITGALFFNGINFAQVLEGEEDAVRGLFETIKKDPRNTGVILISEKEIETRYFPDWSMHQIDGLDLTELHEAMMSE